MNLLSHLQAGHYIIISGMQLHKATISNTTALHGVYVYLSAFTGRKLHCIQRVTKGAKN